ncbi:MAG TPA: Ig domain-containing protein, partial [Vicinamibacterales bacterium]|nr:Ig domain-containing protein [Vicinamibacterales bacterium]
TTLLPDGIRRTFYSRSISATGGTAPLAWSVVSGSLPAGLALNASTGVISGTPRETGTWGFTVRVVDASSPATADTQALSIRIRRR